LIFIHETINTEMRGKRCSGGQPNCRNFIGNYKDVDDVGCCKQCDDYIDENPYDPYWEQMEQAFGDSLEYEEAEKGGLLEHVGGYEKAFEKFQETYEPWPIMRRRMAKKNK
jgi:hypothetical protein